MEGRSAGLNKSNVVAKKKIYEAEFQKRVNVNPTLKAQYGNLLQDLQTAYDEFKDLGLARDYYTEITGRIELFSIFIQLKKLQAAPANKTNSEAVKKALAELYKNYSPAVDKKLFEELMNIYASKQNSRVVSSAILERVKALNMNFAAFADEVFNATTADDPARTTATLEQNPEQVAASLGFDKAYNLYLSMAQAYTDKVLPGLNSLQNRINNLQRTYMQAQMEVFKEKAFYPDANSTFRITYGNVKGYTPKDAVQYDYYSYLDGVMQKYIPGDYEFDVPEKLRDLYAKKDYGPYGKNGKMPVCFIATDHTTGGNSGSPAIDAQGNLVGLNFDRAWEGTMSDINYDPSICRNIIVDIRYVLFIIDKYAGAGYLIKEMKLVHPKGGR
ncbi:MAG: S46 family peptidase [Chitinophagaceae bacterium]